MSRPFSEKLIYSFEPAQFEAFLTGFGVAPKDVGWALWNVDALESLFDRPEYEPLRAVVEDALDQVQTVAGLGMARLDAAFVQLGLTLTANREEDRALVLFNSARGAFEDLWSLALLFGTTASVTSYVFDPRSIRIRDKSVEDFQFVLQAQFVQAGEGLVCRVGSFHDEGRFIICIRHGSTVRPIQYYEPDGLDVERRRVRWPHEDMLVYEPGHGILSVCAKNARDVDRYITTFALCMGGDEDLAVRAQQEPVYSLRSIETGDFNQGADGEAVESVEIVGQKLHMYGENNTVVTIKSDDMAAAYVEELQGLGLDSGALERVSLRYHMRLPGRKARPVGVHLIPPHKARIFQKRYAAAIEKHLRSQGVMR